MSKNGFETMANICRDFVTKELSRKQFAVGFSRENEMLIREYYKQRGRKLTPILTDPKFEKIFPLVDSSLQNINPDDELLLERPLPYWNSMEHRRNHASKLSFGPHNSWEEQIEWTNDGKMWPYPVNNEHLLAEEEQTDFVDHIFLETELSKYKLPPSKTVSHFMELILLGLSRNPYMSVKKKREHIAWFAKYFNGAMASKYRDLLK